MIIITAFIVLGILILFMIIACREQIPDEIDSAFFSAPFYKMGVFLYKRLFEDRDKQSSYYQKLYDAKHTLNPAGHTGEEVAIYFIKKLGLCMMVLFMGMIFIAVLSWKQSDEALIQDGRIEREDTDGKDFELKTKVSFQGEEFVIDDFDLQVASRQYSDEEIMELLPKFHEELEKHFLADNESPDFVSSDVCMDRSIKGYPFLIDYEWDDRTVINHRGELGEAVPAEGVILQVDAKVTYQDFTEHYIFPIHVFPRELERIDYLKERLEKALEEANQNTKTSEYMDLPSQVDGMSIVWTEEKENHMWVFFILIFAGMAGIFLAQDKDLYKQVDDRDIQMMDDYTEIVSKLTLLIGAGMTVRGAWRKIALDYKAKRDDGGEVRFAYEEMLFTVYEMDNGVEETVCYSHFSSRARVQKYVKLVSLLDQNLKLGVSTMLGTLREEAKDAFEDRKNRIEKKGEEAGTKLLVPMILMLCVVVVVIMFPAFMSM